MKVYIEWCGVLSYTYQCVIVSYEALLYEIYANSKIKFTCLQNVVRLFDIHALGHYVPHEASK